MITNKKIYSGFMMCKKVKKRKILFSLIMLLMISFFFACQSDLVFENADGFVTSVGPVFENEDQLFVHYTVYDLEGDPVELTIEYKTTSETWINWEESPQISAVADEITAHVLIMNSSLGITALRIGASQTDNIDFELEAIGIQISQ